MLWKNLNTWRQPLILSYSFCWQSHCCWYRETGKYVTCNLEISRSVGNRSKFRFFAFANIYTLPEYTYVHRWIYLILVSNQWFLNFFLDKPKALVFLGEIERPTCTHAHICILNLYVYWLICVCTHSRMLVFVYWRIRYRRVGWRGGKRYFHTWIRTRFIENKFFIRHPDHQIPFTKLSRFSSASIPLFTFSFPLALVSSLRSIPVLACVEISRPGQNLSTFRPRKRNSREFDSAPSWKSIFSSLFPIYIFLWVPKYIWADIFI